MPHARPFTLRLIFSGVCLFTRAEDADCLEDGICVLMPGATPGPRCAADKKTQLTPHQAQLRFRIKNILGARAVPEFTASMPLLRRRVELRLCETPDADNCLRITREGEGSFDFVPNLQKVAPGYGDIDPQDLTFNPSHDIQSQILLDKGRVYTRADERMWRFPNDLAPEEVRQRIAHQVIVEFTDIVRAKLVLTPLPGKHPRPYFIETLRVAPAPYDEDLVELTIWNFEAPGVPKQRTLPDQPDFDFMWFYELLSCKEYGDLQKKGVCPVPYPIRYAEDASLGRDCFAAQSD